jgi:ATP-dependent exoDNAse (exonuclease V) beta subunit
MSQRIRFISAGAGSGKTYSLASLLEEKLADGSVRPEALLATTFTRKAAGELRERISTRLIGQGRTQDAIRVQQARIGTVNAVCGLLLREFAFDAGLSPDIQVLDEPEADLLFHCALEQAAAPERIAGLEAIAGRLSLDGWRATVRDIAAAARANGVAPAQLAGHARASADALLARFPAPTGDDLDLALRRAMDAALDFCRRQIRVGADTTKATLDYVALLEAQWHQRGVGSQAWTGWLSLAKKAPAKACRSAAAEIQAIAGRYAEHPGLQQDVRDVIAGLLALAADSLTAYQALKAERGWMDFVDQEEQVLALLDRAEVRDRVRERLDLLLVDEFQDTSPIQLAIFLKLAELARESVWVGDIKQAIYGFRSSDPELMNAVLAKLRAEGSPVKVLDRSWRSVPALVHLVNELFVPAFAGLLDPAEVRLEPTREALPATEPLEFWHLEGSNDGRRWAALAAGLAALLAEGSDILDAEAGSRRPLQAGDIAVLCRSNPHAAGIAAALRAAGIEASLSEAGLLATPEAAYALACLRRLVDAGDTLASAEIIALRQEANPETWLEDRLAFLAEAAHDAGHWGIRGALQSPVLQRLENERALLEVLSPLEALDRALLSGEVLDVIAAWGPTPRRSLARQANIEALRRLAAEYEERCGTLGLAATVNGLLVRLKELEAAGEDAKPPIGDQAVQVLTYHGAKGLEWPVVVAADLDIGLRPRVWGLTVAPRADGLDIDAPLAGRALRYWPWPFGKFSAGIEVADAIRQSPLGQAAEAVERREAVRLLYVGLTRARDKLILPFKAGQEGTPAWLGLLEADWLAPTESQTLALPSGVSVPCRTRTWSAPDAVAVPEVYDELPWLPPQRPCLPKPAAFYLPHEGPPVPGAKVGRQWALGSRVNLPNPGEAPVAAVGSALHGIIAASLTDPDHPGNLTMAEALVARWELNEWLDPAEGLRAGQQLREVLVREFGALAFYPEWPVQACLPNGQGLAGWIDLLVETPQGWLIIDHKCQGAGHDPAAAALEHSGQLLAYRQALELASDRPVCGTAIHLVLGGQLVEVVFPE